MLSLLPAPDRGPRRGPGPRLAGGLAVLLAAIWIALAGTAWAQVPPDYQAWEQIASRGETLVEDGAAPPDALEALRAEVVAWRETFSEAQSINAPRIATVEDQIAALGPAPAEGESEAEDIAARRKELTAQLAELQAPGTRAVEAYSRAGSLIKAIDDQARARQTNALLRLSPSPLLPSSWAAAATEGWAVVAGLADDIRARTYGAARTALIQRLPLIMLYLLLALGLLIAGRRWVDQLPSRLSERASDYARDAIAFGASLGQIVIPTAGAYLLVLALDTTGLAGAWGRPILVALPMAALTLFAGRWLTRRFFPLNIDPPLCYPVPLRHRGRLYGSALAAAAAVHHIAAQAFLPLSGIRAGSSPEGRIPLDVSEAAAGVWHLPIILAGALALYRLAMVLRAAREIPTSADTPGYRAKIIIWLSSAARLAAIAAPLAALIGYVTMANAILWPTAMTVGLVALVILLQELAADLWVLLKRNRDGSRDALAPVLIGFGPVLAAIPVLALVWGASPAELAEAWTRLRQGVSFGGVRLSPGAVLTFVVVFTAGYLVTRFVQGTVRNSILPRTRLDAGARNAAVSGIGYVGIFVAALMAITSAGIDLSSLAIVAGALSVGIGFGLQNIVSNFVSGIILLVERPVAVGDWIQVGASQGYVKRISVRSTQIQTFDRTDVIVPNSDLISKEVTNWTRGNQQGRIIVQVGVAYGTDTRRVAAILKEIAEDQPTVLITPPPTIVFAGFGADSLDFEIRAILSDINQGIGVSTEIRHQVIERFKAEGIEIPFTHREVRIINLPDLMKGPLADTAPAAPAPRATGTDASSRVAAAAPSDDGQDPRIASAATSGIEDAAGSDRDSDGDGDGDGRG